MLAFGNDEEENKAEVISKPEACEEGAEECKDEFEVVTHREASDALL